MEGELHCPHCFRKFYGSQKHKSLRRHLRVRHDVEHVPSVEASVTCRILPSESDEVGNAPRSRGVKSPGLVHKDVGVNTDLSLQPGSSLVLGSRPSKLSSMSRFREFPPLLTVGARAESLGFAERELSVQKLMEDLANNLTRTMEDVIGDSPPVLQAEVPLSCPDGLDLAAETKGGLIPPSDGIEFLSEDFTFAVEEIINARPILETQPPVSELLFCPVPNDTSPARSFAFGDLGFVDLAGESGSPLL